MKNIPYGITDFKLVRSDDYYFVDHSWAIPYIEKDRYVFLLRPRRFGKSLFLNMMATYYDILEADNFDTYFSDLAVGKNPTKDHNKYLILKFNFSAIDPQKEEVQEAFNGLVCRTIESFVVKYQALLRPDALSRVLEYKGKSNDMLDQLFIVIAEAHQRAYVMIDEYDNFANTILSYDEDGYARMTHGDGFFRLFFNILKAGTTDNDAAVDRIFMTGVSPLCLSDVTSGFNIGINYSLRPALHSAIGFSESEVRTLFSYYMEQTGVFHHSVDELLDVIRPYYDNYCFTEDNLDDERMFNSDMTLYFLNIYIEKGGVIPKDIIDRNVSTDYNKMQMLIRFESRFGQKSKIIQRIINDGYADYDLIPEFSLANLGVAENVPSLLYYMGLLTWGRDAENYPVMAVPNEVVRYQFLTYMKTCYADTIQWRPDIDHLNELWRACVRRAQWQPFLEYVSGLITDNSSVRDFGPEGESFVKGFMLTYLCSNTGFLAHTEYELSHGFADIFLEPQGYNRHALIVELKYCKPSATDAEVKSLATTAEQQAERYAADHNLAALAASRGWSLSKSVIVFRGWNTEILRVW
ncbi:MAG: AAA family ATPase [Bacteroidales bacterium]|nr:AAA family ATPase [Bacteroidales bacterium]